MRLAFVASTKKALDGGISDALKFNIKQRNDMVQAPHEWSIVIPKIR